MEQGRTLNEIIQPILIGTDIESISPVLLQLADRFDGLNVEDDESIDEQILEVALEARKSIDTESLDITLLKVEMQMSNLSMWRNRVYVADGSRTGRTYWDPTKQTFKEFQQEHAAAKIIIRAKHDTHPAHDVVRDFLKGQLRESINV